MTDPGDAIPLIQHPRFAAAMALCGRAPLTLETGQHVLRRRFRPGLSVAMLPRIAIGPDGPARLADAITAEPRLSRLPLLISPDHPAPDLARIGAIPLMTPATVAELTLKTDQAGLRARMHQKWRNRLTRA